MDHGRQLEPRYGRPVCGLRIARVRAHLCRKGSPGGRREVSGRVRARAYGSRWLTHLVNGVVETARCRSVPLAREGENGRRGSDDPEGQRTEKASRRVVRIRHFA